MWMKVKVLIIINAAMSIPVCINCISLSLLSEKYIQFIMPLNGEGVLLYQSDVKLRSVCKFWNAWGRGKSGVNLEAGVNRDLTANRLMPMALLWTPAEQTAELPWFGLFPSETGYWRDRWGMSFNLSQFYLHGRASCPFRHQAFLFWMRDVSQ